jgi:hypothetical protein
MACLRANQFPEVQPHPNLNHCQTKLISLLHYPKTKRSRTHLRTLVMPLWLSLPSLSIPKCSVQIPIFTIRGPGLYGTGGVPRGVRYSVPSTDNTEIRARRTLERDADVWFGELGDGGLAGRCGKLRVCFDQRNASARHAICANTTLKQTCLASAKANQVSRTDQSVRSRKIAPPGTNAYATVNMLATTRRQYVKRPVVNVRAILPSREADALAR